VYTNSSRESLENAQPTWATCQSSVSGANGKKPSGRHLEPGTYYIISTPESFPHSIYKHDKAIPSPCFRLWDDHLWVKAEAARPPARPQDIRTGRPVKNSRSTQCYYGNANSKFTSESNNDSVLNSWDVDVLQQQEVCARVENTGVMRIENVLNGQIESPIRMPRSSPSVKGTERLPL
jgi:hypothetical protein